jgi:hypothetical protein
VTCALSSISGLKMGIALWELEIMLGTEYFCNRTSFSRLAPFHCNDQVHPAIQQFSRANDVALLSSMRYCQKFHPDNQCCLPANISVNQKSTSLISFYSLMKGLSKSSGPAPKSSVAVVFKSPALFC